MDGRALLAWNLRRLRGERGLSQERLADAAEVDRAYVSEIEREDVAASVDTLDKLVRGLKVPMAELFKLPEPGEKKPALLPGGRPPRDLGKAKRRR
jgi:transcriptional regulator with XRE-family HTH domain